MEMDIKARNDLDLGSNKEKRSSIQKAWMLIKSPKIAMKEIAENPTILFPLLINAFGYVSLALLAFPTFSGPHLKGLMPDLAPDQKNIEIIKILLISPFQTIFPWILYTAIYFGLIKLMKGKGSFKQVAAVTGYSYVTIILWFVVSIVASYFTDVLEFNASFTYLLDLLAPSLKGGLFYKFIFSLNIFTVWQFILIAIGLVEVTKLSKAKIYTMVSLSFGFIVFMNTFFS